MRITAFILLTACLQVSARSNAQTVSISVSNASIEKVFKEIKKQTGYNFFYDAKVLEDANKVSITVRNASLDEVLNLCFKNQPLTYTIIEKTIVVKKKETEKNANEQVVTAFSPPIDILGHITNANGEPLSGANVVLKRTGKGVITDAEGRFTIQDVHTEDVFVVSFVGYKTQSIKVGDRTNFTIIMTVAVDKLDEMVVQAYGKTSQRLTTGNIGKVGSEEIEKHPLMNPIQILQGQIPGLVITSPNGFASGTVKVEIRGRSGINGFIPSDPLYIVDGVPLTILNTNTAASNYASGSQGVIQSGIGSQQ